MENILTTLLRLFRQAKNSQAEIVTEFARLEHKREKTAAQAASPTIDFNTRASIAGVEAVAVYILTFEIDGKKLNCPVSKKVYEQLHEGTYGQLTHQGENFISYEFNGTKVEK